MRPAHDCRWNSSPAASNDRPALRCGVAATGCEGCSNRCSVRRPLAFSVERVEPPSCNSHAEQIHRFGKNDLLIASTRPAVPRIADPLVISTGSQGSVFDVAPLSLSKERHRPVLASMMVPVRGSMMVPVRSASVVDVADAKGNRPDVQLQTPAPSPLARATPATSV
jgi:hypothetical protein